MSIRSIFICKIRKKSVIRYFNNVLKGVDSCYTEGCFTFCRKVSEVLVEEIIGLLALSSATLISFVDSLHSILFKCKCGNSGSVTYCYLKKKKVARCRECYCVSVSGSNSGRFDFNKTQKDRQDLRFLPWYCKWGKDVKILTNFTCIISGQEGYELSSHHIYN